MVLEPVSCNIQCAINGLVSIKWLARRPNHEPEWENSRLLMRYTNSSKSKPTAAEVSVYTQAVRTHRPASRPPWLGFRFAGRELKNRTQWRSKANETLQFSYSMVMFRIAGGSVGVSLGTWTWRTPFVRDALISSSLTFSGRMNEREKEDWLRSCR